MKPEYILLEDTADYVSYKCPKNAYTTIYVKAGETVRYWVHGDLCSSFVFAYEGKLVNRDLRPVARLHLTQTEPQYFAHAERDERHFLNATRLAKLTLLLPDEQA